MSRRPSSPTSAAIESLHGTVTMARVLVESGRIVDLAGLDAEAAALCAAVCQLPPPEARVLRPALQALLRDVTGLAAVLPAPR